MLFGGIALAVLLVTGCSAARPLHRSHASIRASLLEKTPPGTSRQEVKKFIAKEGWDVNRDNNASLLRRAAKQGGGPPVPDEVKSVLMVEFGGYFIWFGTRHVYGLWGFDPNDHLVGIWVYKENDVL